MLRFPATRSATLTAPAKINLDLRVLHKRADGYHELRTVFQTVSLADRIEIAFTPDSETAIETRSSVAIDGNLLKKAAVAVLDHCRVTGRVSFSLTKRIPLGGGLGGGSTDAAAVLLALPVLTGTPVALPALIELAGELGSDVPFFLLGGAALGVGTGTEIYPLPDLPRLPAVLAAPGIHVSTAEAYASLARQLTDESRSPTMNTFQSLIWGATGGLPPCDWSPVNDFESAVFARHPRLQAIKTALAHSGAQIALMTGSGSSLFGLYGGERERDEAATQLRENFNGMEVHAVSLMSRRQYRALWRRQLRAHITSGDASNRDSWPPQSRYAK